MTHPLLTLASQVAGWLPQPLRRAFYRLGPFTRLLRNLLNRAAPVGTQQVQIAAGLLQGLPFRLDMQSEKDYWLGTYEPELQEAIRQWVKPGAVVYEAGANVGYISLCLGCAAGPQGEVYCFEPLPENVARLCENLELNQDVCKFHVLPMAVAGKSGQAQFQVHASDDMGKLVGSAGRPETYQQSISVETVKLDDMVYRRGAPSPQVVKMDIEGGEVLALPGMERLLHEARPLFLLELHGPESVVAAWQALTEAGYSIHRLRKGYPRVTDPDELDWKAYLLGRPPA
jgi:FkbM family methyltransferase